MGLKMEKVVHEGCYFMLEIAMRCPSPPPLPESYNTVSSKAVRLWL